MFALLALVSAHACPIPHVAYMTERTLSTAQYHQLERYGACVCASAGVNYEVYRDPRESRYRFHPSCERVGRNGRHYQGER